MMKRTFLPGSHRTRRRFLKEGAVLGLSAVTPSPAAPRLPEISLGPHRVSRLIVGSNPMLGYSHLTGLVSRMMSEYFTVERIADFLGHCTRLGINTFQSSYDAKLEEALDKFRENGGQIQWICLANRELLTERNALQRVVQRHHPLGVVHHGWPCDRHFRAGTMDRVHDFCKMARDLGVLVGVSTHNPQILRYLHRQHWEEVDFYMASCHFVSRTREELQEKLGHVLVPDNREVYLEEDPPAMFEAVRETDKPVLVYKILAAGRYCTGPEAVENRFRFAFQHIKPTDAVIVGMFPRFEDQARMNVEFTLRWG